MLKPRDRFIRSSRHCIVSFALILGIQIALGFAAAVSSYDGFCYGFTDGRFPCTLGERAVNEISFLSIIGCLLTPIPFLLWGLALGQVIAASAQLRPLISGVLALALAIAGVPIGFLVGIQFVDVLRVIVKFIGV
jgi:hypothetical protein